MHIAGHAVKVEKVSKDILIHFLSQSTEKCVEGIPYPTHDIVTESGACTPEAECFQLLCCCLPNQVSIDN